jgi:predicted transposase/invertase (TIGR01784 family)
MDSAIQKMQDQIDLISRDPAMLRAYEQAARAASGYTSDINAAQRKGEKRGEQSKAIAIARNLKRDGESASKVARMTGLPLEQIERL